MEGPLASKSNALIAVGGLPSGKSRRTMATKDVARIAGMPPTKISCPTSPPPKKLKEVYNGKEKLLQERRNQVSGRRLALRLDLRPPVPVKKQAQPSKNVELEIHFSSE